MKKLSKIFIPADVPKNAQKEFIQNYETITKKSGRLFLFAADQKIEHLNDDFVSKNLPKEIADPTHLFTIASKGEIGAFATQLGLIASYGKDYPNIPYIIKLNSKTNLIPTTKKDPYSSFLWDIEDVITFKKESGLSICGVGYTVYLGSEFESDMLHEAAQLIFQAHQYGLITILWMYPRGKNIKNEHDAHLIAGAVGVGACLGADFVKTQVPKNAKGEYDSKLLQEIVKAAGRTKVICSGGPLQKTDTFLQQVKEQLEIGGVAGCAVGRNIFQKKSSEAIEFTKKLAKIVLEK